MDQDQNDQVGGMSDHEKFGESSSFGNAPASESNTQTSTPRVYDKVEESSASARDRAVQMKRQLADKLETGAGRLRQRATNTQKIDNAIATTKQRVVETSDRVAAGMERSADWLRNTNVSSFQEGLERRVRENPGRTLLIAGAIGYLLGRAFKGKDA
jgi:ElaB/YqjD/DUF883 family membrane-anchored ribosome-binding protein